jgi:uridine kinase
VAPRHLVLAELGDALASVHAPDRLTRIGIDGVDGAGKTSLAEEIAQLLTKRERPSVRVSLDFFKRSPAERYARGELSPEGYYLDSFDVERLRAHLLSLDGPRDLVVVVDASAISRHSSATSRSSVRGNARRSSCATRGSTRRSSSGSRDRDEVA